MPMDYKQYQDEIVMDVGVVLAKAECQPIVFIGSGFSRRYAGGPNWEELLRQLAGICPRIDREFAYYKQAYSGDLKRIGSVFADAFREWAWAEGRAEFPEECFGENAPPDIFVKTKIAELLAGLGSSKGGYGSKALDQEIKAFRNISAHAIITTNYDELIEPLFPEYERVIGQQVLRKAYLSIGEIFKIHGCRSEPGTLVFHQEDYDRFNEDHKYLSAKLLTYFVEHPLLFVGYRAEDPNIKSILYDVYRMTRAGGGLIPNIYILEWDESVDASSYPPRDKVISVAPDVNMRVKCIVASGFEWVFKAFGQAGNLEKINTKLLRALMARSVELVRSNIPKKHVEVDFQQLEQTVESGESFAKLFGVTSIADPSKVNIDYKYALTGVAQKLGFKTWHKASELINLLQSQSGFDMRATDNKYHIAIKLGHKSTMLGHRYTDAAVDVLRKVMDGDAYELDKSAVSL
ncbi:hypothetical protein A7X87_13330 [Stenotrophomonas maltophilia]|nr:hypothetical protein A7X87_13330 [Stenotrophomonas maltophilia]